ncbi:DNA repair protein RecN [Lachnoclostridium sp. An196]|uniref:DNA repair protein RecN n=1 Tax=Lachnoclostridium sp. An196 TaxID=1965583 RepID=UPI000B3841F0|nr:DNA repair protein RecN [Lachnoclostridium sp. An196]OUP19093.1 DNA repair protein RecN [Lachnoclostridium sp. An196]
MLQHLHVKNLALIREAEIDFTEGLNILTGETGAGKSIIIGSITMALGGRVAREMIREDADQALVELVFSTDRPEILEWMDRLGIPAEDGQLILSRKISGNRSLCRLNGETVSASVLKEAASYLIDIHGQHEHQSLLNRRKHLEILDDYAHGELGPLKKQLTDVYHACRELEKKLEEASADETGRLREQELLEFEISEIEEAALEDGEDEQLEQRYRKMVNGKKILEALSAARLLCGGEDGSASDQIGRACREVTGALRYDENLQNLSDQIQEIDGMLSDFFRELSDYMEGLEFSGEEFQETEERLNRINHLKAKYGQTIGEIRAYQEEKQKRLDILAHFEEYTAKLKKDYEEARKTLETLCGQAHRIREKQAEILAELMQQQLAELNFLDVRFQIEVRKTEQYGADGYDEVEFMISTNPGEPLKPLGRIASGGELSRVMLAIKTVLADQDAIDTVIFDEIDTGISGRTAQKVSEKLALIGKSRQVICITHLAQLAAMADSHYCIEKFAAGGGTQTSIRRLTEEEAVDELARILGGASITESVKENAREMRRLALQLKEK